MSAPIAWIAQPNAATSAEAHWAGRWGQPDDLCLPLNDRGLLLGDGLFETVFLENGELRLLEEHLQRWSASAALLGMAAPPGISAIEALVDEAMRRSGIGTGALRLNWSRGSSGRGLDLPAPGAPQPVHRFWLQLTPAQPCFQPVSAVISRSERRNAASSLSRCKTLAYAGQVQARLEARAAGADDALLLSCGGDLSCGSAANLLLRRAGRWQTPPLTSGCLPGVMRGRALSLGLAEEAVLEPEALQDCEAALLINSLGCRPIHRCEGRLLPSVDASLAQRFWRTLLGLAETAPI